MTTDIFEARHVDLTVGDDELPFARDNRDAIAAHWARRVADNPAIWNGSAFLFRDLFRDPATAAVKAHAARVDFATFLYWRDGDVTVTPFVHIFPVPAIVTADSRLLVGRMSKHTVNPGRLYPPAGSFDASDEADGRLHPLANMHREVGEEIGLDLADMTGGDTFLMMPSGPHRYALVRVFRHAGTVADIAGAVAAHVADHHEQELDEVLYVPLGEQVDARLAVPYVNPLLAYLARTL